MIQTRGLTKRFGDILAMDSLDLEVVPVLALLFAQIAGVIAIGLETILIAVVVLGAADYALVGVGARLFERETILTRWR